MASIALMIGGAIINATTFVGGSYLAKYLSGSSDSDEEKKRHDLAVEKYQKEYEKYEENRAKLNDWIMTNDRIKDEAKQNFKNTDYALQLYNKIHQDDLKLREPSFPTFISQVHNKNKVKSFTLELRLWQLVLQQVISFKMENKKLSKIYYSPKGFWKGLPAVKKLSQEAGVSEDKGKLWLMKQAIWQIYFPAPRTIPRPTFDVDLPNAVHQADLLFHPHDQLPRGKKIFKYALTVVDVASRFKAAEPLTSKDSSEVSEGPFGKFMKDH